MDKPRYPSLHQINTRVWLKVQEPTDGLNPLPNPADFSLVLGGRLSQIVRRAHLSGDALELLRR